MGKQKEKVLYAPYCNINTLEYDRNEGYVNIPDRFVAFTKRTADEDLNIDADDEELTKNNKHFKLNEGVRMVRELQEFKQGEKNESDNEFEFMDGVGYKSDENEIKNNSKFNSKFSNDIDVNINEENESDED